MMRKTFPILGGMLAASLSLASVAAEHASAQAAPAWTPGTLGQALQAMPKGDAVRGKQLHSDNFCASCHGEAGESTTMNWPSLLGQRAEYTYKMLLDYKTERRAEDARGHLMVTAVHYLSEQDMADLAAFYAAQPLPAMKGGNDVAEKLVRKGDPTRLVTPCAACHGLHGQGGVNETPALAGMTPEYFVRTMKLYRDGTRNSDAAQAMRAFAKPLTDAEIEALAAYYAEAAQ
ncbi:MAG TPA: c-type cytochrome [Chromatiales bacterium]|nr:c-type cytochrome [Chromatiales bacterium]